MYKKIGVTGMGIISSIGNNVEENHASLLNKKSGIAHILHLNTRHKSKLKVGEIPFSNSELIRKLSLPANNNFSRTTLLGIWATREAVQQAGITNINSAKTGLVSSTSVGGMDMTEKYYNKFLHDSSVQKYIKSHHAGDSSQKIAEELGIQASIVTTISTACSSAANAIMHGARLILCGKLDRVIVGGADCLSKFTLNGFNTLMILTDHLNKPFDDNRKGLNLGEAAAFLVLESEEIIKKENKKVLAYLNGFGNANDAYHQTASSDFGDGAALAMEKALENSGLKISDINYINAHGTATRNNDLSEGRAILKVFKEKVPPFSSTKPYTGHTLAAAGGIEAVYSILSIQNQEIYPTLNFETPMKEFNLLPETKFLKKELNNVMSNSLGFGGNCSTLIFSK